MKDFLLKEKYRIGLLAFLLLLFGVINGQAYYQKIAKSNTPIPTLTPAAIQNKETPTPSSVPTNVPKNTMVLSPTQTPPPAFSLQAFFYPGALTVSSNSDSLTLTSSDDTDKITDWYSQKIRELSMNVKTTVKTKTNGNVNNKVAGAKNNTSVSITIIKEASQSTSTITISLQ